MLNTLRTVWTRLKATFRERARYARWALQPALAERAVMAALDHGVRKGFVVTDQWRMDAVSARSYDPRCPSLRTSRRPTS